MSFDWRYSTPEAVLPQLLRFGALQPGHCKHDKCANAPLRHERVVVVNHPIKGPVITSMQFPMATVCHILHLWTMPNNVRKETQESGKNIGQRCSAY